ncbi:alpha-(1,3)-fucosyltransferase 7-like [Cydia amplana]|uniref:alpha-(1,3)-fucosyltransferase 7-like n=1 Tax=Cydia amplana TaxID=1869771 RepID=UPI002FE4FC2C
MREHHKVVYMYYDKRKAWTTSNLGRYMFKYYNTKPPSHEVINYPERGHFNILIWRYWPWLKQRHEAGFDNHSVNPLFGCSVTNCKFFENNDTYSYISSMDAVVVHLQKGLLPDFSKRKPYQRWIFWTDESPIHTFAVDIKRRETPTLSQLANVFNWSMSYRTDSDIPVPYGRTIPLLYPKLNDIADDELTQLVPYWKQKQRDILAAIIMSRCVGFRMRFVMQLQRFFNVDMFGKCALVNNHTNRCPGRYTHDCPIISKYLFYIVIENSKCRQYISEKVFHHAYSKGAIPIIMGSPLVDCVKLLPPNSFIHMDNFASVKHLAREVYAISGNIPKLLSYHAWRNNFKTVEEHGFLGTRSLAMCRICEALNYNSNARKVYGIDDIMLYLDPAVCCSRNP